MAHMHSQTRFDGALAKVVDVRCRTPASPVGGEEQARSHQLVFTRSGAFVKHAAAGARREVVAEPLHVLCLNANEPFRVSHPADGGDDCTAISFPDHAVLDAAASFDPHLADAPARPFRITHAPLASSALLRFRALRRLLGMPGDDGLAVEEESIALLGTALRAGYRAHGLAAPRARPRRTGTQRDHRDLAERTKEALAARPADPRSLSELARDVHSSPYHLARVFREHVGLAVHQYRVKLRLALALDRLDEGERNLGALALDLGFASHSHLTTQFRRTFGVTPNAFRHARYDSLLRGVARRP